MIKIKEKFIEITARDTGEKRYSLHLTLFVRSANGEERFLWRTAVDLPGFWHPTLPNAKERTEWILARTEAWRLIDQDLLQFRNKVNNWLLFQELSLFQKIRLIIKNRKDKLSGSGIEDPSVGVDPGLFKYKKLSK